MQKRLIQLLSIPLFEGIDDERATKLLSFVFRLTILIAIVLLMLNALISFELPRLFPMLITIGITWGLSRMLVRGQLRAAGIFYLLFLWGIIMVMTLFSGGLSSYVFGMFGVWVFFAGVIFGTRGGYSAAALALLTGMLLIGLETIQQLPAPLLTYRLIDRLIIEFAIYLSLLSLLYGMMHHLREALAQARQEVLERRQAEEAFRQLERRYQAIFDRTNDAVVLMDFDSTILDINQRGAEMFGLPREQLIGQHGLKFVAPDERQEGQNSLTKIINGQVLPIYERKMLRADGQEFLVEVNLSMVCDEHGKGVQTQSVIRDITERKKTEAMLRDIENRYKALFEGNNDGIFIIDMHTIIRDVNQRAARMLGFTPEEMIDRPAAEFVLQEEQEDVRNRLSTMLEGQTMPLYERKSRCKDGTLIPLEINAMVVYGLDGNPQAIQSFVRDLTERKQAEENLRQLVRQLELQRIKIQTALEVSKTVISILDPKALIQQIVNLVKERFEYYYVGLFLLSEDRKHVVLSAGTGDEGKQMLTQGHTLPVGQGSMVGWSVANKQARIALDVGLDAVHFDNPLLPDTRSEMSLPLLVRGEAIGAITIQSAVEAAFNEEDIAVLRVVADLVAIAIENASLHAQLTNYAEDLEQKVAERTTQLQTTNRELESFSYTVSHDLRTPLRAIHGYSSILLEEFQHELPHMARSFQLKIRDNAIKMGKLIDGLLDFSRLGRKKIQKSEVHPLSLVQEILEDFSQDIKSRNIEIILTDLPPCLADPLLLKQVFANLLSNAFKFSQGHDKPQIKIGSEPTEYGPAYFVQDNGVGFDMQFTGRLFDVFQRLHREDEFEGTGIGLASIKRIIQRHGGKVWAESEIGKGAKFYFTLGTSIVEESSIFFSD